MITEINPESIDWTPTEIATGVAILHKMGTTCLGSKRLPSEVFLAMCEHTTTNPVELALIRDDPEQGPQVLMSQRSTGDKYFPSGWWHLPGTVLEPTQTAHTGLARLFRNEVGIELAEFGRMPEFIDSQDIAKGNGPGQCTRGAEINRIYMLTLDPDEADRIPLNDKKKFFTIWSIPEKTLEHHKTMIECLKKHLGF